MKNSNKTLRIIIIFIILIPIFFYVLPKAIFYWSVCKGIQDSGGLVGDMMFVDYCPEEAVEEWYENLFWQECVKQDQQIPPNAELLISACTDPIVRGVPGGEFLFVHEKKTSEIYLLDLRTGEKKQMLPNFGDSFGGTFLTSELVWVSGWQRPGDINYRPHYVLDLTDYQKYELVDLDEDFDTVLNNNEFNPIIVNYLTESEQVFIDPTQNRLVILAPNFRQQTGKSMVIPLFTFNLKTSEIRDLLEVVEKLLRELQVNYEIIDFSTRYVDQLSPTGKYVIRNFGSSGIYYAGTDTPLVLVSFRNPDLDAFVGWYSDERSIVLALGRFFYFTDNPWGRSFSFPGPVLKLNLPIP